MRCAGTGSAGAARGNETSDHVHREREILAQACSGGVVAVVALPMLHLGGGVVTLAVGLAFRLLCACADVVQTCVPNSC